MNYFGKFTADLWNLVTLQCSVNGDRKKTENIIFVHPMAKWYKYRLNNANERPLADELAPRQINRIISFVFVDFYCTKTDCKAFSCAIDSWRVWYTNVTKCLIKVCCDKTALNRRKTGWQIGHSLNWFELHSELRKHKDRAILCIVYVSESKTSDSVLFCWLFLFCIFPTSEWQNIANLFGTTHTYIKV